MTDNQVKSGSGSSRYLIAALPLVIVATLFGVFGWQIMFGRDPSEIPSVLIGKKAPQLDLPALEGSQLPALTSDEIDGKLTLVNVFASWCIPCREEHPFIMALSRDPQINVVGINYKDNPDNALRFLGELGNPYSAVGVDRKGAAAIDWGVYGIPESFVVGPDGTIIFKKVGPIDAKSYEREILPVINRTVGPASKLMN
ncbi:DsbE family thiol:disulfide interchange protein [Martelella mediterranea]|uniref:Cytochrome c biogenesis protein CcmG/thiol:disulfide interchange protein DsbE n=1 Tax=Martelella mediterranea TaxID=293089 RepID=A0A4R3NXA7_9HYPH|nr:DsbE family thiol:disulfide interchange protein [Martelella mediterranea]TCT43106.1 cytochrome c biogenesis protein CcmG/thiol:disulfide interchange protein DsbE [Martelella mediterranea]